MTTPNAGETAEKYQADDGVIFTLTKYGMRESVCTPARGMGTELLRKLNNFDALVACCHRALEFYTGSWERADCFSDEIAELKATLAACGVLEALHAKRAADARGNGK